MNSLEQKRAAPELKAVAANIAIGAVLAILVNTDKPRPALVAATGMGVALWFIGRRWE